MRAAPALLVLLVAAAVSGCGSKPDAGEPTPPAPSPPDEAPTDGGNDEVTDAAALGTGRVVFESSYINFAWGFQLQGRYIDEDGSIWEFSRGPDQPWIARTTIDGRLLAGSMDLKLQDANYIGRVDPAELARMAALIRPASEAELTRRQAGADMGADSLVGYLYDPEAEAYTVVTLRSRGDWDIDNPSDAAATLVEWLERVLLAPE